MAKILPERPEVGELLCFAVYSASHAFNRVYKPLLDGLGLTYPQYLVMIALWNKDDQTVGGLGEALFLESSTLTPLLKRLEGLGYVSRRRDSADERQVRVRLTQPGAALREKARDIPSCILDSTGLSDEQVGQLQAVISGMRDNMFKASR